MSKFCTACGATLTDDATFCTNCGTPTVPLQSAPMPGQTAGMPGNMPGGMPGNMPGTMPGAMPGPAPNDAAMDSMRNVVTGSNPAAVKNALAMENIKNLRSKPNTKTVIGICVISVVVVAIVVVLLVILLSGGYKKAIDNLLDAYRTGDGKYYLELLTDGEQSTMNEKIENSKKYDSLEEYYDDIFEAKKQQLEDRYGENFSVKYNISEKQELNETMLKSYASNYKQYYGKKVDVSAGYVIDLEVSWSGEKKEDDNDKSITVLKVDGDWVIPGDPTDALFPRALGGTSNGSSLSSGYNDYDLGDYGDYDLGDYGDLDLGDIAGLF